jgi:hypothetical protein
MFYEDSVEKATNSKNVSFDVGAIIYKTYLGTLKQSKYLYNLADSSYYHKENEPIFIDRYGPLF